MPKPIRIVTDSSAHFADPTVVQRLNITVIPQEVQFSARSYREGIDLDAAGFFERVRNTDYMPHLNAPSRERFADLYSMLGRETDQILSLHLSRSIHPTWQNAQGAAQNMLGRCDINVLDSQTASVGLGFLVEAAAELAQQTDSLANLVRIVRKLIPRIYCVFCVDTLDYLRRGGLLSEPQAILGTMLGMKPFITIEDGELMPIEKTRTRTQSIDTFIEFVMEFGPESVEKMVLLHNNPHVSEQTRILQERLAAECHLTNYPLLVYKPSLGCILGPDATGIVIFERSEETQQDDDE